MALQFATGVIGRIGTTAYWAPEHLNLTGLVYNGVDMLVCVVASKFFIKAFPHQKKNDLINDFVFILSMLGSRYLGMAAGGLATSLIGPNEITWDKAEQINLVTALLILDVTLIQRPLTGKMIFPICN